MDRKSNNKRFVKVLLKYPDESSNEESERIFQEEINNMQELDHPNIIKIVEITETESFLFLITEFAHGFNVLDT